MTAFEELLSVLFGRRIRVLEDPDPVVFRDTFLAGSARKVRIYPLKPSKPTRKLARK